LGLVGEGLLERAHQRRVAGNPRELAFPLKKKKNYVFYIKDSMINSYS
jgi:hypothetical protein